jgi:6-phosphogluconolactonase
MAEHFITLAKEAILTRGHFYAALSGGSTPKAIYQELKLNHKNSIDWSKVSFFFSDERAVPPDHVDSNYHSAIQNGILELGVPPSQIHRMVAEKEINDHAMHYENLIKKIVPHAIFDLIMLGMGEDGHTASLFPHTDGLKVENRLVIANHVPSKKCDRMTFTFPLINQARLAVFYVMGNGKKEMVKTILTKNFHHLDFPATLVGSEKNPALWILDHDAAMLL